MSMTRQQLYKGERPECAGPKGEGTPTCRWAAAARRPTRHEDDSVILSLLSKGMGLSGWQQREAQYIGAIF